MGAGAGKDSMNGWYRRKEIDAKPPAGWLRLTQTTGWTLADLTKHWYKYIVKDSPGWYHSVSNNSFIYWHALSLHCGNRWRMTDEDGRLMYLYNTPHGAVPDFPPRDGWDSF